MRPKCCSLIDYAVYKLPSLLSGMPNDCVIFVPSETPGEINSHRAAAYKSQASLLFQGCQTIAAIFVPRKTPGEINSHRAAAYKSQASLLFQGCQTIALFLFPVEHPEK